MQEKLENQDDVSRNPRYRRIQMQLCKDLDPIVHSQGYVKKSYNCDGQYLIWQKIWFDLWINLAFYEKIFSLCYF